MISEGLRPQNITLPPTNKDWPPARQSHQAPGARIPGLVVREIPAWSALSPPPQAATPASQNPSPASFACRGLKALPPAGEPCLLGRSVIPVLREIPSLPPSSAGNSPGLSPLGDSPPSPPPSGRLIPLRGIWPTLPLVEGLRCEPTGRLMLSPQPPLAGLPPKPASFWSPGR